MLSNLLVYKHRMNKLEEAPPDVITVIFSSRAGDSGNVSYEGYFQCEDYSVPHVVSVKPPNKYVHASGTNSSTFMLLTATTYKISISLTGSTPIYQYQVGAPRYVCNSDGIPLLCTFLESVSDQSPATYDPALSMPDPYSSSYLVYDGLSEVLLGIEMTSLSDRIKLAVNGEGYFYIVSVPVSRDKFSCYAMRAHGTLFEYFFESIGATKKVPGIDYTITMSISVYVPPPL